MARELFIPTNFRPASLAVIEQANAIIVEYQGKGFTLTLRQLYYQFVSRALIPNKQSEYKRLGSIVNDARLAGMMDWDAIEDRTRNLESPTAWASPSSIVAGVAEWYQEDLWRSQDYRPEVWIEKEALAGVVAGICGELRVPHFACRGYTSQSEAYSAGKRFEGYRRRGQVPIVFHLGDHDPSGIDMTRDNRDRLTTFARRGVEVRRLALNMAQIREYNPPPNPAKDTDARFAGYQAEHGDESWELDALDPEVIADLVSTAVNSIRDDAAWSAAKLVEEANKARLQAVSDRWSEVVEFVEGDEE